MNKPWLKHYPEGIPEYIETEKYKSLVDYLEKNFKKFAKYPAFENLNVSLSYAEIDKKSQNFAAFLQSELGLKKGDRFAIMMPNLLQYIITMFAALRAGLIVVNVNPLYTKRELIHQLNDSGAKAIILLSNFAYVLQKALPKTRVEHVIVTQAGDAFPFVKANLVNFVVKYIKKMVPQWKIANTYCYRKAIILGKKLKYQTVEVVHDDIAYLQYTGGTTGVAKGAILTHGNILANIEQTRAWFSPFLTPKKKEVMVTALPLYHIFALTVNCWALIQEGARNVLITNPRDISSFVKTLLKIKMTCTIGVNTLFNALLNNPDFAKVDFSGLRFIVSGGMAPQQEVCERWKKLTGLNLSEGYGLTETSPVVSATPLSNDYFTGSIGIPFPSTECAVMNDDGEMPIGEEGELCVRGPQVMRGYWNRPDATDKVITHDGWLRTGDIAKMDKDGYFYILDRKKNMVVISGFNVYPNEVEDIVTQIPGIDEAAVIGVADKIRGEYLKLFVVKKDPSLTAEEIKKHCYENLTRYKVPKDIEFRDELPKSNVGKILHRKLRDEQENLAKNRIKKA